MFEIADAYFISVVIFFAVLALLIYRDRRHVEFHTVVVMRRTERFRSMLNSIANLSPRFWKAVATFGIAAAVCVMVYGLYLLLTTARSIVLGLVKQPALQLILPTPASTGASGPGYLLIPFWFWIITIAVILIPHEMMHGIVARAEKIRLRSVGLLLLAIFPGAFVEPDEKQLKKSRLLTRLRIFAAGSFANFSIALIILALLAFVAWPLAAGNGVVLETVAAGSPAALAGLVPGQVLTGANGVNITSTYWEYAAGRGYLVDEVGMPAIGDNVTFVSGGKAYVTRVAANPETGAPYVGITYRPVMSVSVTPFFTAVNLFSMIWVFSLAVGMINILPLYPLDGGLMFEAVMKKCLKGRRARMATRAAAYVLVLLLAFDFLGPWLIGLF